MVPLLKSGIMSLNMLTSNEFSNFIYVISTKHGTTFSQKAVPQIPGILSTFINIIATYMNPHIYCKIYFCNKYICIQKFGTNLVNKHCVQSKLVRDTKMIHSIMPRIRSNYIPIKKSSILFFCITKKDYPFQVVFSYQILFYCIKHLSIKYISWQLILIFKIAFRRTLCKHIPITHQF